MKRQRRQQKWYDRFFAYRILGIPIGSWLVILILIGFMAGVFYIFIIRESDRPPTSETFVAEVSDKDSELYANEGGSYTILRVRLRRDDEEFTCRVSPVLIRLFYRLEIGKSYEFLVNRTRTRCYIYEAIEIDETQPFGGSK